MYGPHGVRPPSAADPRLCRRPLVRSSARMSDSIVFVLVGTTHAGNLGAAARAMKAMGFGAEALRLVEPYCSPTDPKGMARAAGAEDLLEGATSFDTLVEALADRRRIYGTSARARQIGAPMLGVRQAAEEVGAAGEAGADGAAFVFGRERSGLTNEELELCTRQLHIATDPAFSSLNLGSAVQIVAHELAQSLGRFGTASAYRSAPTSAVAAAAASGVPPEAAPDEDDRPVDGAAMEHFHAHLERVATLTGFLDPERPRLLRRRLRRYFERNRPSRNEMSILRGILSSVERPKVRRGRVAADGSGRPGGADAD